MGQNRAQGGKVKEQGKTLDEIREEMRKLMLDRLEVVRSAIWARVMEGDLDAIGWVLRIAERRAALLGLDAPERFEVEIL